MGLIKGEARQDGATGKWAWVIITVADDKVFNQSEYVYGSQLEAENHLVEILKGLEEMAKEGEYV